MSVCDQEVAQRIHGQLGGVIERGAHGHAIVSRVRTASEGHHPIRTRVSRNFTARGVNLSDDVAASLGHKNVPGSVYRDSSRAVEPGRSSQIAVAVIRCRSARDAGRSRQVTCNRGKIAGDRVDATDSIAICVRDINVSAMVKRHREWLVVALGAGAPGIGVIAPVVHGRTAATGHDQPRSVLNRCLSPCCCRAAKQ